MLLIADVRAVDKAMLPVIQSSAKKIGITFTVRTVNGAYPAIQTTSKNVPISQRPRWVKDYADPSTFIDPLFNGANIIPTGNTNYSLIGMKPGQAGQLGVKGSINNVPSIDAAVEQVPERLWVIRESPATRASIGSLTTEVVPWVPYMSAKAVTSSGQTSRRWNFDQSSGYAGLGARRSEVVNEVID